MEGLIRTGRFRVTTLAGIAGVLACTGCGNGGSGSSDDNPPPPGGDQAAPLAVVQFPPDGLTDAAQASLVIAVTDETGVALVRAGGVPAVLDSDSLWKVTVPLIGGDNLIRVETRDTLGNSSASAARVSLRRESALWIEPSGLAFDEQAGEALVLDTALRTLFRVDLGGVRSVLSSPGVGSGTPFADPRDVDHVAALNAAVVTDGQFDSVILVDLATGNRTTLSNSGIGTGPGFLDLHGIAVESARNRALVVDEIRAELMAVDLTSGDRTTVSGGGVGSGPALIGPRRIGIDVARNRALVTIVPLRSILAVDLATGNRSVLSGGTTGAGPAFVTPSDLVADLFRDRALVADPGARAVFAVDLTTGQREIFSAPGRGLGPAWLAPAAVALHLGAAPLVIDRSLDALFEVGALSGDRFILSGIARGAGPQFLRPAGLASGLVNPERLAVADPAELFASGVANGARALVSGSTRGAGAPFNELADVAVARAAFPCVTVLDAGLPGIVAVDQTTGNRSVISGPGVGAGPPFAGPRAFALQPTFAPDCANFALVVDNPLGEPDSVMRVDLSTGERTVLSDVDHGLGLDWIDPVAIEITQVPHVLDAQAGTIVAVDETTGDRTPIFQLPALFGTPTDLAFDVQRNRFLVTVADPPALLVCDVESQTSTVLSDATRGAGPLLGRPRAIELVPSATLGTIPSRLNAYVLDSARGSILVVDLETGERVIQTK